MEAGHPAAALRQCGQRVDAAGKAQVDVQAMVAVGHVAQHRQRQVVAGKDGQHMLAAIERGGQHAFQLGAQGLDVRCQAGAGALLGPQQAVGKGGQPRRLALRPGDERLAERVFPALERTPDVAVAGAQVLGRMLDRAVLMHGLQQLEQRVVQRRAALAGGLEAVLEVDAARVHAKNCCSLCNSLSRLGLPAHAASRFQSVATKALNRSL